MTGLPPDPVVPASRRTEDQADPADESAAKADVPQFRYVEEFVRHQLSASLGGARGMIESALPFVAFTIAWVVGRQLYPALGAAVGVALVMAVIRLAQRQSVKFVAQAVFPTAIAALIATRTGRAQDIFLPGILYNGGLALLSLFTVAIRRPLVGFIIGAAVGEPTGLGQGSRTRPDDLQTDAGPRRPVHHPVRDPDAPLPGR